MQALYDFFTFRYFISPGFLLLCYLSGAVGIPAGAWIAAKRTVSLRGKGEPLPRPDDPERGRVPGDAGRGRFFSLFVLFFLAMEVLWRVMFEFLLAFLQMREALLELAQLK